ncbi:hypothetical protein [Desulfotignum balticum]|jgi:biotin operon repressor|uniref:hypothetical protein n=1 Tax=Desulfotignum balticum TaxID=115781 RepID=UPI0004070E18|nr:hypothetical protein [Desulfotignum balticum]
MSGGKRINCVYCGKAKLSRNEVGLNKKFIHQKVERMMCLECLADYFEMTEEELKEMIERFKREGCELFL